MKTDSDEIVTNTWKYSTVELSAETLVANITSAVTVGIANYDIISINNEQGRERSDYNRTFVEIPISRELFDSFFNSRTGYRARYCVSEELGEQFNAQIVDAIVPKIIEAESLYTEDVNRDFCERSLRGPYTKVWFPTSITDPSYEPNLLKLPEEIQVPMWVEYWKRRAPPRKGLLAPKPDESAILLNGTFVRRHDWDVWNQKPDRSSELNQIGWT